MPITTADQTSLSTLNINTFDTYAEYQSAYNANLIQPNEICIINEEIQYDWAQTNSAATDFIKNKPEPQVIDTGDEIMMAKGEQTTLKAGNYTGFGYLIQAIPYPPFYTLVEIENMAYHDFGGIN